MRFKLMWAALVMVLAATGCKSDSQSPGQASGEPGGRLTVGVVFDKGGRGDKSFNDSAWRGVERAKTDFGIEEKTVESKSESDYEPNLTALADQGADLIVAVGLAMKDAVSKVAPNYPDVKFALVDAVVEAPNVRSLKFKEEEGSFLAGYLAGLTTKTGKVGFVGGMKIPLIEKFFAGFAAGAATANPNVIVLPEKYTGSWDNVDGGKVAANVLFGAGADVVYHASGKCGLGVIGAAQEHKRFAIGVDSDQDHLAPGYVLTSMIKRVDEAVYQTIKDLREGKFTGGERVFDLASGGVGISDLTYTKDKVPPDAISKLNAIAAQIKEGALKVPTTRAELDAFLALRSPSIQ